MATSRKPPFETLRCRGDRQLEARLVANADIRRALGRWDKEEAPRARQQLLARAVRLTPPMSPRLDGLVQHCKACLGVTESVELYVYPEPSFNAACSSMPQYAACSFTRQGKEDSVSGAST